MNTLKNLLFLNDDERLLALLLTTISKIPPPFCYLLLYSVLHLQVQYIIVVPYCQGQE